MVERRVMRSSLAAQQSATERIILCLAPYNLDGAIGMNRDGFGYAPHEQAIQAAASVRAQNDQVGWPQLCGIEDHSAGYPDGCRRIAHGLASCAEKDSLCRFDC